MVRLWRRGFGIATGQVVVGDLIGEGAAQEEAVIGETPNLAARLQVLAEPGSVVIGPSTRRLIGKLFTLDDLGHRELKGFAVPVPAWRVVDAADAGSRFEALRGSYRTPLVGREHALEMLAATRQETMAGDGRMVALVGEPGVGKSRLVDSFLHAAGSANWQLRRCGCLSYGTGTSWVPVIELIRNYVGIEDRDNRKQADAKLEAGLDALGSGMAAAITPLRALLDLPLDDPAWQVLNPPQRRRRMIDAVKSLLFLASEQAPLALLFEDLHWADGETLVLLDSLVESLARHRILLLVTYRPEFQHGWSHRACYRQMRVDALPEAGARQLLAALLGSAPSLAELKRQLIVRTEGNPLFLEEAVYDLAERGVLSGEPGRYRLVGAVDQLHLPQTVQAILAARIDRLTPEAKQLLRRAAVIGHDVPRALLEAVADLPPDELDHKLAELQAAEMLLEMRLLPEVEYAFRHALTHDVVQAGLLRETRHSLHRRVGEAMEVLYPERLVELAESLADHFEQGEVWAKATLHALSAAEKAKSRYAYPVGLQLARRARDSSAKEPNLTKEQIWANILLGDLASLVDDLELANHSYDQALTISDDPTERQWIANKRHEPYFAERHGGKITYYVHGSGDATLVIVIPITYGLSIFQPIIERLCQEMRIVTINPRGTIGSDPVPPTYTLVDHALDVVAVGEGPVTAMGISLGATTLAHAATAAPALFEKLVMVGAAYGTPAANSVRAKNMADERRAVAEGDFETALRMLSARIISEPGTEDLQELRLETLLRLPKETIINFYQRHAPNHMAAIPLLRTLGKPTLVLHGSADIRTPVEEGRRLADGVDGALFHAFEGRCHLCMFTATEEFCTVLRDFVLEGTVSNRVE